MRVSELIEKLQCMNQDLPVYVPMMQENEVYQLVNEVEDVEMGGLDDPDDETICVRIQ